MLTPLVMLPVECGDALHTAGETCCNPCPGAFEGTMKLSCCSRGVRYCSNDSSWNRSRNLRIAVGGDRSAWGVGRYTFGVNMALSMAQPVVRFTMEPEIRRLRAAAERERHDVVDLQPIAGAAAPPAAAVDISATTLVAPPHLAPHGRRDVPCPAGADAVRPPSSPNAVSNAQRVRVEGFSYSNAKLIPARR